jgi:hypothetical protein
MDSSLLILCDQLFCVKIVLPRLLGKVQPRHSPLHATWKCHVIVESLPWNPRWLHYHMGFTQQRWVSAKYNLPTSIILLWILFGIVTRSKYYMASHKLQLKQININFLFPKFVLRVFFSPTLLLFSTFVWTWPCIYTKTQDQNKLIKCQ